MSRPAISIKELSPTLSLVERHPTGEIRHPYWIWDQTRGINIAMGEKTPEDAFVKALTYYQGRLIDVENNYRILRDKVDAFINEIMPVEEY